MQGSVFLQTISMKMIAADLQLRAPPDINVDPRLQLGPAAVPHAARARAVPDHALEGVQQVVQQAGPGPPLSADQGERERETEIERTPADIILQGGLGSYSLSISPSNFTAECE